jgi:hypothetical protein
MLTPEERKKIDNSLTQSKPKENLYRAVSFEPDKQAEIIKLSDSRKLPMDTVERNLGKVKQQEQFKRIDLDGYPKTTEYFNDDRNARVSVDDIDNLKELENTVTESNKNVFERSGATLLNRVNKLTGSLIGAYGTAERGLTSALHEAGLPSPGVWEDEEGWHFGDIPEGTSFLAGEVGKAVSKGKGYEVTPYYDLKRIKKDASVQNVLGMVLEQGPSSVADMLAAVFTPGLYFTARTQEIAETILENKKLTRDVVLTDLPQAAMTAGLVTAIERFSGKIVLGRGGVTGVGTGVKATTTAGLIEGSTEVAQETIEYFGETAGTKKKMTVAELLDRQLSGFIVGTGVGTSIRGTTATVEAINHKTVQKIQNNIRTMDDQQLIDKIVTLSQSSKTQTRMSDRYQQFVESLDSDKQVHISKASLTDAMDAGIEIPSYIIDQFDSPLPDITIPLSRFASDLAANDELMEVIREHTKLNADTMTMSEIQEESADSIRDLMEKANKEKELLTESQEIYEDVKEQLVSTERQGEATARFSAAVIPEWIANYADRAGKTVKEVYDSIGLKVVGDVKVGDKVFKQSDIDQYSAEDIAFFKEQGLISEEEATKLISDETTRPQISTENARPISGIAPRETWRETTAIKAEAEPAIVYRGAESPASQVDFENLGAATGHPSSTLGMWFSSDQTDAATYGQTSEHFLDIQNPKEYNADDSPVFDSPEEYTQLREELISQGFDGIVLDYRDIEGPVHFVAFNADSVMESEKVSRETLKQEDGEVENLIVTHNLSSENILAAADLGGLAAPSIATIRTDISDFSSFGEVSLLADRLLLKSSKAHTFDADIYSPRQPRPTYDIDLTKFNNLLNEMSEFENLGLSAPDINSLEDGTGADNLQRSDALQYLWLQEQGKAPKLKKAKIENIVKKADKLRLSHVDMIGNSKFIKIVTEHYQRELDQLTDKGFDVRAEKMTNWYFNDDGTIKLSKLRDTASSVIRFRDSGGFDTAQLRNDISKKMRVKKTRDEYDLWVTNKFNDMVTSKKLFKGFTPSGNRRYVDYDMQSVVKDMTQKLQAGETFFYGAGTVRSAYANEMKTIKQIQAKRDDIVSEEDMTKVKEESSDVFSQSLDKLKQFYKFNSSSWGYAEDAGTAIIEGRKGLNETFNMTPEAQGIVDDLTEYLAALPSTYFETKIQRPVEFSEFDTAVVPKGMNKNALKVLKDAGLKIKTYDDKKKTRQQVISEQKKLLFQEGDKQPDRGEFKPIGVNPDLESSIIKLSKSSDLSSFLHESTHLFLDMEARLSIASDEITTDQKTILKFLALDSFEELVISEEGVTDKQREAHEKWAETFEVYFREGKAPSANLKEAFAAFKQWLMRIYKTLSDPRLARADLNPEIKEVFDRLLASEAQITQIQSDPAYDQLFKSAEQAGMTDAQWDAYNKQKQKSQNRAQESIDTKLIKELQRRATKDWADEKKPLIEEELQRLAETPVYQLKALLKTNPMEREALRSLLGMAKKPTKEERLAAAKVIDTANDSLLVAAARSGGLNMEVWEAEGVDPAYLKSNDVFNNKQVFGMPVFRKDKGLTPDDLAEIANENGYGKDLSANEVLDLVFTELEGNPVYTPEGYENIETIKYRQEFGETDKPLSKIENFVNRITKAKGVDPYEYKELFEYPSIEAMVQVLIDAKPIKQAAKDSAEQIMINKHGDILNDGSIELEVRESVHNEEQAKLLLMELRALNRNAPVYDREILKAKAKETIAEMKFSEIKPSRHYQAEIRYAKLSISDPDNAYQHKLQQLVNHYLYKESVRVRESMVKQRKYIRGLQTKQYSNRVVDPIYSSNIRVLSSAYDMKKGAQKESDVRSIVNWMVTQINDQNDFIDFDVYDPALIEMVTNYEKGAPIDYTLTRFEDMTAEEMKGVADQLKHMRYLGGRLAQGKKETLNNLRKQAADSIIEQGGKAKPFKHEVTPWQRTAELVKGFFYSHRRLGGIFETLDGFELGKPMAKVYQMINEATNKELELTSGMSESMDSAFKDVLELISRRRTSTITKQDGKPFNLTHRARFVLGLNWGNEGNREAVLLGLNEKSGEEYTEVDILNMLSTMSDPEIRALDQVWDAKEPLWGEMSGVEVRLKGVSPAKIEASPFMLNGIEIKGGHYRLHYMKDPSDSIRTQISSDMAVDNRIKLKTASSLNTRVGSGGRQVDLELGHLFSDMAEDIHYIAYAEMADNLNALFKGVNNPVVGAIVKHYDQAYYDNLIESLSVITRPSEPSSAPFKFLKFVRSNLTYAYLAFSVRNIVQQPIAITNTFAQLGMGQTLKGVMEFYANPIEQMEQIKSTSQFMKNRTALVNREAREQLMKIDSIHPKMGAMKNMAFAPQTFMDSLIAYPTWLGAKDKFLNENPLGTEKEANTYADEMVAKTIGSGLSKDLGSILTQGEHMKQLTFMGTFFNLTWNLHVENAQLLKKGKISGMEYARRVGWMAIMPAVMSMWLLDDLPEDDEDKLIHAMKEVGYYNMASLFLLRDLSSTLDGFDPSIPGLQFAKGIKRVTTEMRDLMTGDEEFDANTVASILRGLQPLVPIPGSGQAARTLEGYADPNQDKWGMLVEGKERNK